MWRSECDGVCGGQMSRFVLETTSDHDGRQIRPMSATCEESSKNKLAIERRPELPAGTFVS